MIPFGELIGELLLGMGIALAGANAWVLLRPRFSPPAKQKQLPPIPSRRRIYRNIAIGLVLGVVGVLSLIAKS